ncbi:CDP-diacylglycerol--serine O-phosphatidyltransferase [soil metagenome]
MNNNELPPVSKPTRPRGIYLLPNLLTTAALFAGFYSIVAAMKGHFDTAAIAIFIAMIADSLDGRIARMTNTQTAFGVEYDSISDMVSFGIAPALVVYSWALESMGKFGWLVAFIYVAATALRLARFNTQIVSEDKRYFQGLPSPAAAAIIASLVWFGNNYGHVEGLVTLVIALLTIFPAVLMVSNIRYYSFKEFDMRGKVPFVAILAIVLTFVAISIDPPNVLFLLFFGYALSGPILTLWRLQKARSDRKRRA